MSLYADQKRSHLAQVSADAFALTKKRLDEDLPVEADNSSKAAEKQAQAEVKEEAEQSAETQIKVEQGDAKPGANSTQKGAK